MNLRHQQRNKSRKMIILILIVFSVSVIVYAETVIKLPEPELIRERTFSEIPENYYCPEPVEKVVEEFFSVDKMTIGAEFLFLTRDVFPEAGIIDIYNGMLGFSNMVGITYTTSKAKEPKTLVYESFRIADPENKQPLPDLILKEPAAELKIFVFQNMDDFGDIVWEVDYRYNGDIITAELSNIGPIYMGPFKIVDPRNLSVLLTAVPAGNDVVLYQTGKVYSSSMQLLSFLGFKGYLQETFYQRMKAISSVYSTSNF
jgi:hypothetical protein